MEFDTSVFFDGFDISTIDDVTVYNYEAKDLPDRDLKVNKIARSDKSVLTTAEYTTKEIRVYGRICAASNDDREQIFTELKGYIQQPNKLLKVEQSGTEVEWTSTLQSISQETYGNILKFVLIFLASDPIGSDSEDTTLLDVDDITTATSTQGITVGGSYKALPLFRVTVDAVTGGSDQSISLLNSETGQGITVTRTWTAADVLEVDSENMTVTVNGGTVDFTGLFPTFFPGSRILSYVDTFSTRDVDITVTYQKKYS